MVEKYQILNKMEKENRFSFKKQMIKIKTPEDILSAQVVVPNGSILPMSSIASSELTTGISQIRGIWMVKNYYFTSYSTSSYDH